jgi:PadR family transcriptional regulator PadR
MAKTNPPFMTGVPELLVLRLLSRSSMYGYELATAIRAVSRDAIRLGEGVIYPALHALEESGALRSRREPVGGRTRVYYSITATGRRRLAELVGEWKRVSDGIASVLEGGARA